MLVNAIIGASIEGEVTMQPQLIRKDGSTFSLTDEQYEQVLDMLGLEEQPRIALTPEEADALLDELEEIGASWGVSTEDLLEERRKERDIERAKEKRYGIS
jgi:hypothetical protein